MSWLNNITDLAGKAESLLNNIDQSAAVAISKASDQIKDDEAPKESLKKSRSATTLKRETSNSKLETLDGNASKESTQMSRAKAQTLRREVERAKKATSSTDDALFDFLNSSKKVKSRSMPVTPRPMRLQKDDNNGSKTTNTNAAKDLTTLGAIEISRSSSYDSLNSKRSRRTTSENGSLASDPHESNSEDVITFPTDSTASESEFEMVGSMASKSDRDSPSTNSQESSSDVAIENRLLRSEITSLHQELTQITERNKKKREDLQQMNQDFRNRCDDLSEEMKVKNTQISALNMRLKESEQVLQLEKKSTAQLRSENERVLLDQSEGSGMHARAIEELRVRLGETENYLAQERHAHSNSQQEIIELRSRQEHEAKKVVESLQRSEREQQQEKKKIDELTLETRNLRTNLTSAKQELVDYKQKAARILQSKERLISSLKGSGETEMTSSTIASLELEELKQERDAAREDLHAARIELANIKVDFQDTEQQFQQDQSLLQQEINELRHDLDEEGRGRREAESELHRLQEDGRRDKEENARARALTQSRLHDKDMEIERLRNQLMLRSQSTPQENELESRLRQLTEAVIQKQSLVETLSAEKSSLLLQLERMEGQVKRLSQEGSSHVNLNIDDDDLRSRGNMTSHVLEFNHGGSEYGVVGKVKKAASALDRFSIRLGVFLKRYPPARLFVLIYMGLLHLWVMVVLLTYTPEAHDEQFLRTLKSDADH